MNPGELSIANAPKVHPGQKWTKDDLLALMELAVAQQDSLPSLNLATFGTQDWADLNWNASEAKIRSIPPNIWLPRFLKKLMIPQDLINGYLIVASGKVIEAWQLVLTHPRLKASEFSGNFGQFQLLIRQAHGRLEESSRKLESLSTGHQFLRSYSLRQYRLYRYLFGVYLDLEPFVEKLHHWANSSLDEEQKQWHQEKKNELDWHLRELNLHLKIQLEKPALWDRMRIDGIEINRLIACLAELHGVWLDNTIQEISRVFDQVNESQ